MREGASRVGTPSDELVVDRRTGLQRLKQIGTGLLGAGELVGRSFGIGQRAGSTSTAMACAA